MAHASVDLVDSRQQNSVHAAKRSQTTFEPVLYGGRVRNEAAQESNERVGAR